jgi:hypothetical protein
VVEDLKERRGEERGEKKEEEEVVSARVLER